MGLRVIPGSIKVNESRLVVDDPHAKVWIVDLISKYASVGFIGDTDVYLWATPETMDIDESLGEFTTLCTGLPTNWTVFAQVARYTVTIFAYRENPALVEGDE